MIEAALAHVVQNRVEVAYSRSDLFERRRRLMDDWARYLAQGSGDDPEPVEEGDPWFLPQCVAGAPNRLIKFSPTKSLYSPLNHTDSIILSRLRLTHLLLKSRVLRVIGPIGSAAQGKYAPLIPGSGLKVVGFPQGETCDLCSVGPHSSGAHRCGSWCQ